jgi:hypothetical protein
LERVAVVYLGGAFAFAHARAEIEPQLDRRLARAVL